MHDVAIIGGGLAGAVLAQLLRKMNYNVVILDKGDTPGFHLPETMLLDDIQPLKQYGLSEDELEGILSTDMLACFRSQQGTQDIIIHHRFHDAASTKLFRVNRVALDACLLRKAIDLGVIYKPGADVQFITMHNDDTSIVYRELGECKTLTAKYVVDASGKASLIAKQLNLKQEIKKLSDNQLVFSHFENQAFVSQLDARMVYISENSQGHVFVIPLGDKRFSIGAVLKNAADIPAKMLEQAFLSATSEVSWVHDAITQSSRKLPYLKAINESFVSKVFCTKQYLLIGEATGFRDPFYSNGIAITLAMIPQAYAAISHLLNQGHDSLAICDKTNKLFSEIIKTNETAVSQWVQQHSIQITPTTLLDPHIPYGITRFLQSLTKRVLEYDEIL